ncbi:MAG TPA: hypothetical protein VF721_18715 [Pyrinomonadaceae bacterium]|jgi:hypothetical protein
MVKNFFKKRLFFILVLSLSAVCFLDFNVLAQQNVDFLDLKIKTKDKRTLVKSINILTEKLRKEKWAEVYDLLLRDPVEGRTKEEFVREMEEDSKNPALNRKVIKFSPKSFLVFKNEENREQVRISGCLNVSAKGGKYKYWGTLDAERNGTEKWFFTSLPIVNPNSSSGGPKTCD